MSYAEAERFLTDYKGLLKAWVMASTGFSDRGEAQLLQQLNDGQSVLAAIKEEFPELSDVADMLLQARTKVSD